MATNNDKALAWAERAQMMMNRRGVTYDGIAPALNVTSRSAVGHYLAGRRQLSALQAIALAERLGCRIAWLLTGEMPIEPPEEGGNIGLSPKQLTDRIAVLPLKVQVAIAALVDSMSDSTPHRSSQRGKSPGRKQTKR